MEAKSRSADVGDVDSSSSSALVDTELSPASFSLPKAALGIVGSQPVTPMMLFFSITSIHMYCNGKAGTCFPGECPAPHCRAAHTGPFLLEMLLFD